MQVPEACHLRPCRRFGHNAACLASASKYVASRVKCAQLRENSLSRSCFMDRAGLKPIPSRRPDSRHRPLRHARLDREAVPFAEAHCARAVTAGLAGRRGGQLERFPFGCANPGRLLSLTRNAQRPAPARPARRGHEGLPAARPSGLNRAPDGAGSGKHIVLLDVARCVPQGSANHLSWCVRGILPVSVLARRTRSLSASSRARRLAPDELGLPARQHREGRRAT